MKQWIKDFLAVVLFGSFCLFSDMARPASGQGVAEDQTAKVEKCKQILKDELHIGVALGQGKSADHLKLDAMQVRGKLGEERYAHVLELIDQANVEYLQGKLSKWFNGYWVACLNPV